MKMTNENDRIRFLEREKEEVVEQINSLEITINKLKEVKDELPYQNEITFKFNRFMTELENQKSNNEEIKEQIENDIISVRGLK